ncbi:MAG: hypothetical protein SXV54_08710 [Chloroflexota bacterium]|nr:hypothetical protein [Chloroflexota bacterium]
MTTLRRIVVSLSGAERSALTELAERELREPRDQARLILRCELERLGLLPPADAADQAQKHK